MQQIDIGLYRMLMLIKSTTLSPPLNDNTTTEHLAFWEGFVHPVPYSYMLMINFNLLHVFHRNQKNSKVILYFTPRVVPERLANKFSSLHFQCKFSTQNPLHRVLWRQILEWYSMTMQKGGEGLVWNEIACIRVENSLTKNPFILH